MRRKFKTSSAAPPVSGRDWDKKGEKERGGKKRRSGDWKNETVNSPFPGMSKRRGKEKRKREKNTDFYDSP